MCRAFLSPWFKQGGMKPLNDSDTPVFTGRFNIGAVTLNLIMIYQKAKLENKDFYKVLDYYLEMIRKIHIKTYSYLGEMKASTNPLAYCEGGFYGGNLKPNEKIKPLLKSATASFGITGLNELQTLHSGKTLVKDNEFALEVMKYINKKVEQFKYEDGNLYAVYGTPAEKLCFSGDTEVQSYPQNKKIKDIKAGDLVYSFNEQNYKVELKKVLMSQLTKKKSLVVRVAFDNGQHIICTPNHPFGVIKKQRQFTDEEYIEYVEAKHLKKGDSIKSNYIRRNSEGRSQRPIYDDGKPQHLYWHCTEDCKHPLEQNHKVMSVELLQDLIDVYDIEVEDNHNFFVGGNDGILVHNCGLQIKQFRDKFGIIKGVSDRTYTSNSFHCGVWEDITPIQKQDKEKQFWDLFNGGKIQYVKYPIGYNIEAIKTLIRRAMELGFYEGVNLALSYCDECGYKEENMEICPMCGSKDITKIDRMNGYLSYSRIKGDTRLNDAKMDEIKDRVSM